MEAKLKRCSKCRKELLATPKCFNRAARRGDGLHPWCKSCMSAAKAAHYEQNSRRLRAKQTIWRQRNRVHDRKLKAAYNSRRRSRDPIFRLLGNCRRRISVIVKKGPRRGFRLVGCSGEQLRCYLESLFTEGMSWSNYGKWEVDHIRPCAAFDLSKEDDLAACFHYTNLQPLWRKDNRQKGDSYCVAT